MRLGLMIVIGALALAGCHKAAPPAVTPPPAPKPAPPPAPPPPPPPAAPAPRAPVAGAWRFQPGAACTATVASPAISLDVSAAAGQLRLVAHVPGKKPLPAKAALTIAFTGAGGGWNIPGRVSGKRDVAASQPVSEDAAGRVLVLLDGGVVRVGKPGLGLPRLGVPNAGADGSAWFECVRGQLQP